MRVLLIQPSMILSEAASQHAAPFLPLGLGFVAEILRQRDHQVKILDAYTEGWEERGLIEGDCVEIGLPEEEVASIIRRYQPQIVGFSVPLTAQMPRLRSLARWVKAIHPEIFIICGGNHPSCAAAEVLAIPEVDAVVLGEAECSLPQLLTALENAATLENVEGIAYRSPQGAPVIQPATSRTQDLDSLPWPAYDLLPLTKFFKISGSRQMPILTSRGCQRQCSTCSARHLSGSHRQRWSAEYLVKQMGFLSENYGVREFSFDDHGLLADVALAHCLFDLLIAENLRVQWQATGALEFDPPDEQLLVKMKQSGGRALHFNIGSGSRRVLQQILKKPLELHRIEEAIGRALAHNFGISCEFLLGSPGETIEEIYETLNFAWKLRSRGVADFQFLIATPFVGTDLREQAEKLGCYVTCEDVLLNPFDFAISTVGLPALEAVRVRDTAEREFSSRGLVFELARRKGPASRPLRKPEERYFESVAPASRQRPQRPLPLPYRRTTPQTQ